MIIFMGVAGAGKSVQGKLLAEHLGYQWLSTGEYLRNNISGQRRQEMLEGKLLNDDEIITILKEFFAGIQDKSHCILDGFPRTLAQAEWLNQQHLNGNITIDAVVYLEASKEVATERLLARGRPDDTKQVLNRRFDEYEKQTLPILEWLVAKGHVVHTIDAERSVQDIQQDIIKKITSK